MIDHIGIAVSDLDRSVAFYTKALAPLGYTVFARHGDHVGFAVGGKADFWITRGGIIGKVHVSFATDKRSLVQAFYDAAIAGGGTDNGKPGVREIYHPSYYGGFVLDPDGNNVEAVCHLPYLG